MAKAATKPKSESKPEVAPATTGDAKIADPPNVESAPKKSKAKPKIKRKLKATMAAKSTTPKRKAEVMAKTKTRKTRGNKSEKIRQALAATPDKPAAEIARQLKVNPALVYNVKAGMAKKAGKAKGKPGRKPGPKASKNGAPVSAHNALDSAFEFVKNVGGLLHAEQLIGKLKEIKERL